MNVAYTASIKPLSRPGPALAGSNHDEQEDDVRKYRQNASSTVRIDYGIEVVAGLRFFSQTQAYVESFEQLNNELSASYELRVSKRKPHLEARAALRFAGYQMDQVIRNFARAAEIADNGRRGSIAKAMFPDGVTPVVAPLGTRQLPATDALIDRAKRCKVPGCEALVAEWLPKLEEARAVLAQAAEAAKAAHNAYLDAFKDELALRAEHYLAVERLMGLVRAALPSDRAAQNLIFPSVSDSEREAPDDDDGDDDGAEE